MASTQIGRINVADVLAVDASVAQTTGGADYGITSTGFNPKPFARLLAEKVALAQALFGDDIDLTSGSAIRKLLEVSALEDARTWSVHKIDFGRLKRKHPGVNEVLLALLAGQVRRLSARVAEALYVPAPKRVRLHVYQLARAYADGEAAPVVPLTQETIGQLAGTSRAQVNEVLRQEAAAGVLEVGRGKIRVVDLEGLARRVGAP